MNGFSVCNKLKKDPALKDVPLIIMSSESSDETFEQHRKLRTRAEDYVHKPIAFGELLEHMRPYVQFENGAGPIVRRGRGHHHRRRSSSTSRRGDERRQRRPQRRAPKVDAEVEAFANNAFDRLLDAEVDAGARKRSAEPKTEAPSAGSRARRSPAKSSMPPRPTVDAEVERLQTEVERHKTEMARLERELSTRSPKSSGWKTTSSAKRRRTSKWCGCSASSTRSASRRRPGQRWAASPAASSSTCARR